MEIIKFGIDFIFHIDKYLAALIAQFGIFTYIILFLVLFCETGLVITPFLPGDSLLFIAGTLASTGSFNIVILYLVILSAAVLGDTVNYWIGYHIGNRIYHMKRIPFINKEQLDKAHHFYQKHGGVTIILARFIPIMRTFAPFVAGIGKMEYSRFISFNIIGGLAWTALFTFGGYFFGNFPFVQKNLHTVLIVIIVVSLIPPVIEVIKSKRAKKELPLSSTPIP